MERMLTVTAILAVCFFCTVAQKSKTTPSTEVGYMNCQWRMFGFYLDMPEPDALKRIPTLQLSNEGYAYSYAAQVTFDVSAPRYSPYEDRMTLRFRRGRVLSMSVILSETLRSYHIDQLTEMGCEALQLAQRVGGLNRRTRRS